MRPVPSVQQEQRLPEQQVPWRQQPVPWRQQLVPSPRQPAQQLSLQQRLRPEPLRPSCRQRL